MGPQIDHGDNLEQVLVRQQTLFKAFVQETSMQSHNLVDRLDFLEALFELVPVGLQYFNLHVVHIIFAELEHPVAKGITRLKFTLHIAVFGGLVSEPRALQELLDILALEQMAEYQLILID